MTNKIKFNKSQEIAIFKGSNYYSKLLDCFSSNSSKNKLTTDLEKTEISKAIFFHLVKMKHAGWKMRIDFNRGKKHALSDFFQDIVAFYLKVSLSNLFEI